MRRLGIVGACLAVVAAFGVLSAANAVASEPALYECAKAAKVGKKYTGKYTDKKCSKLATTKEIEEGKTNKYELKEGFGKGKVFKGKGKGANLEVVGIGGIGCSGSTDSGKFTSPKTAGKVVAVFKGCELNGKKCESGSTVGEVVTNDLDGEVGYLEGKGTKTPKVGADIKAESGEILATVHCANDTFAVTGSVIGEVEPANKFTKEATFIFKQKAIGVQEWSRLEGGPEDVLVPHVCEFEGCNPFGERSFTTQSSEETTVVNKGEELMLKA